MIFDRIGEYTRQFQEIFAKISCDFKITAVDSVAAF